MTEILFCADEVDGNSPSPFRGENMGILSTVCCWYTLLRNGRITNDHRLLLYCDNEGAVGHGDRMVSLRICFLGRDKPDLDILYCLREVVPNVRGMITITWVKGHQKGEHLPLEALLNIRADELASKGAESARRLPIIKLREPTGCDLVINGKSVTGKKGMAI